MPSSEKPPSDAREKAEAWLRTPRPVALRESQWADDLTFLLEAERQEGKAEEEAACVKRGHLTERDLEKIRQEGREEALQTVLTYLRHGDAASDAMPYGLFTTFQEWVAERDAEIAKLREQGRVLANSSMRFFAGCGKLEQESASLREQVACLEVERDGAETRARLILDYKDRATGESASLRLEVERVRVTAEAFLAQVAKVEEATLWMFVRAPYSGPNYGAEKADLMAALSALSSPPAEPPSAAATCTCGLLTRAQGLHHSDCPAAAPASYYDRFLLYDPEGEADARRMESDAGPVEPVVASPVPADGGVRGHVLGHGGADGTFVPAVGPPVVAPASQEPCFHCEGEQLDGYECEHCGRVHRWPVAGVGRGAVVPEEPTWEYNMEQRDIGAKLMVQQIRRAIESGRGRFSDPDANWIVDQGMKPQPVEASTSYDKFIPPAALSLAEEARMEWEGRCPRCDEWVEDVGLCLSKHAPVEEPALIRDHKFEACPEPSDCFMGTTWNHCHHESRVTGTLADLCLEPLARHVQASTEEKR